MGGVTPPAVTSASSRAFSLGLKALRLCEIRGLGRKELLSWGVLPLPHLLPPLPLSHGAAHRWVSDRALHPLGCFPLGFEAALPAELVGPAAF